MVGFRHVSGSLHPVDPDLGAVQVGWCGGRAVRRDVGVAIGGRLWAHARDAGGRKREAEDRMREAGGGRRGGFARDMLGPGGQREA